METLESFLDGHAAGDLLPWAAQLEASRRFGLSVGDVEGAVLARGLLPARYQRNRATIPQAGQRRLFASRVAVVGCGGLGGYVIEELARLGVGAIVAIDPDTFEEHNLNRQLLSAPAALGTAKVEAAAARVAEVNPAVTLVPVRKAFDPENGAALLAGCGVAVDCLDAIASRLALAERCAGLGVPLVHGAIAGWYGQVTTQMPGERSVASVYESQGAGAGVETSLGNPAFTPAVVASLQAAEACKLLLGRGEPLRGRQLIVDLLSMEFTVIATGGKEG